MHRLITQERIAREALRLLRECSIHRPPVRVEVIAKHLGAVLRYEPFEDDVSGVLFRDRQSTTIGVSSLHHPNRQRFTIAHEIGHLVLHEMEVHVDKGYRVALRNSISSQAVDPHEIEANRFAAELLMPVHFLRADLQSFMHDMEDDSELRELARKYRVSTQAMAYRLGNLDLFV
jgi:Zn-dependent peptidase ImmA (M78 family)